MKIKNKKDLRKRRHNRLRRKVIGTKERPRMSVYISGRHIYVQFIDDLTSVTMASVSTIDALSKQRRSAVTAEIAKKIGALAADAARQKGIEKVIFDRGGFAYNKRMKSLADAARSGGLIF